MPRAHIKDEKTYRKLRESGNSGEKAARIANAAAGSSRRKVGARGGRSPASRTGPRPTWSSGPRRLASRAGHR